MRGDKHIPTFEFDDVAAELVDEVAEFRKQLRDNRREARWLRLADHEVDACGEKANLQAACTTTHRASE